MLRQIDYVLPKLKFSVYIQQVVAWLENFEENEVALALDYLFYLEYIPFSELQARLNSCLMELDKSFGRKLNYLLVPYAEYPKSNDVFMYLLSKCPAYAELKKEKRISFTLDIGKFAFEKHTVLVFVDDFIGTGRSFDKWYRKSKITALLQSNALIFEVQAILSAIVMEDGDLFIRHSFPEIRVVADIRYRIFSKSDSPFNLSNNRAELRNLCLKYGNRIATGFRAKATYAPLGYENSEALVAFDYGTPNNTLSIIWGEKEWMPIYPRQARARMQKSSQIKGDAQFYLGVMHRLGINFDRDVEMES